MNSSIEDLRSFNYNSGKLLYCITNTTNETYKGKQILNTRNVFASSILSRNNSQLVLIAEQTIILNIK